MTWMPKFRGTGDEEDENTSGPGPIPKADADRLAQMPYSLKPTFTDIGSAEAMPVTITDRKEQDPAVAAWVEKHPEGLDLGSNEKQVEALRAARRAVKGKRMVDVGRPSMPEDKPRDFTDLAVLAPGGGNRVESVVAERKAASDQSSPSASMPRSGVDPDMLEAEQLANARRTREGMYAAGRMIGRAGLAKNPQAAQMDAAAMASADEPLKFVAGQKAEARKKAEDLRAEEDQGFQRSANARAEETQGFNREEQQRKRDYNDERSQVSVRRRAEALALYPKELARIPKEIFNRASAADVDVWLKELNMQKDRAAGAAGQKDFLRRLDALGKGSQQFGELDQVGQRLESLSPGITSGHAGKDMNLSVGDKLLMAAPWGVGEGFVDKDKAGYSRALDDLQAQIGYMRSGKVISEHEEAALKGVLGRLAGQPPDAQARGIGQIFQELKQRQRNFQASYGYGEVGGETPLGAFEKSGGTSYRHPPGSGGGRRTTRTDPATGETREWNGTAWVPLQH